MIRRAATFCAALLGVGACVADVFYVAPDGNDAGPGSAGQPLATLAQARDRVRAVLAQNAPLTEDLEVVFQPGEYLVDSTVVFDARDAGRDGHRVIYRSQEGLDSAILVGAARLTGWTLHTNGIWKRAGVTGPVGSVYEDGQRAWGARTPNRPALKDLDYPGTFAPYLNAATGTASTLVYTAGDLSPTNWVLGDSSRLVYWNFVDAAKKRLDWGMSERTLLSADPLTRTLEVNYINTSNANLIGTGERYFVKGVYALLDQPGEFFHDSSAGVLYYRPLRGGDPNLRDVRVPQALTLLEVVGTPDQIVSNVTFSGLTFRYTRYVSPLNPLLGALRLQHVRDVVVERCHFANLGAFAILGQARMDHCAIRDTWIERAGMGGILLMNNYPRATYPERRNEYNTIEDCLLHNLGEETINAVYNGGVLLWSVNHCSVRHCEIFVNPRYAISMRGHYSSEQIPADSGAHPSFSNEFSHIKIQRVGTDSGDMGAVHAAAINEPGGPYRSTWRQLRVREVYAHASMKDVGPNGIFMDHPHSSEYQLFENIDIGETQGASFRGNQNPVQFFSNCTWVAGFDRSRMEYGAIGLTDQFPYGPAVSYWPFDSASGHQQDQIRANDLKTLAGATSALYPTNRIPHPETWPFEEGRSPSVNSNSLYEPILDGGIVPDLEMNDWSSWTFEGWFRVDNQPTQTMFLAGTDQGPAFAPDSNFVGWHIMMDLTGQLTFLANSATRGSTAAVTPGGWADARWHHFAAVWDHTWQPSGELRLYVDGRAEASASGVGDLGQNNKFSIGARETGSAPGVLDENRWRGRLDEFRLSRGALDPGEFLIGYAALPRPGSMAVTNVSASGATVTWQAPGGGEAGFHVYLSTNSVQPPTPVQSTTTTEFGLTGLVPDTLYRTWVQAFNATGVSLSALATFATAFAAGSRPPTPRAYRDRDALVVEWEDTLATETGYVVQRATGPGDPFVTVARKGANIRFYSDLDWGLDATYAYRIAAVNDVLGLTSDWSEVAQIVTPSFAITNLPGVHLWLDAADFTATGRVARWSDKSGSGYHMTQSVAALQPQVVPQAAGGHAVLRFAATNWLSCGMPTAGQFGLGGFCLFAVYASPAAAQTVIAKGSFGNNGDWELGQRADHFRWKSANYLGRTTGDLRVRAWRRTPTAWQYYENGELVDQTTADLGESFSTSGSLYVGRRGNPIANYLNGDIAEIVMYTSPLTETNFYLVNRYLIDKWFALGFQDGLDPVVLSASEAVLRGRLLGGPATLSVAWGDQEPVDPGNLDQWQNVQTLPYVNNSDFSLPVGGLLYGVRYSYRFFASNPASNAWAEGPGHFLTARPLGDVFINEAAQAPANVSALLATDVHSEEAVYEVRAHWGLWPGGTQQGAWAQSAVMGSYTNERVTAGLPVSNLVPGLTYYVGFSASNVAGEVWSAFPLTLVPPAGGMNVTSHGTPHWWYERLGIQGDLEAIDAGDEDGDGMSGWEEFRAGTDPLDPASTFRVLEAGLEGGRYVLRWHGGWTGAQLPWSVETTAAPADPEGWIPFAEGLPSRPDEQGRNEWSVDLGASTSSVPRLFRPAVRWP